jgi:hypothetical protein
MRSNFREIPDFLEIASECGITSVCFQTVEINHENSARFPMLATDELIRVRGEALELHGILGDMVARNKGRFQFRFSGLTDLFAEHGLDSSILNEVEDGLYPDSDDLKERGTDAPAFELCPNPWTTLFVVENGDVHLCFLAQPVGNLYETPLSEIWNSPAALMKRSRMIAGRYRESGCSQQWCSWREGSRQPLPKSSDREMMLAEFKHLVQQADGKSAELSGDSEIRAVRRMLVSKNRRISELEAMFRQMCEVNLQLHESGQAYIAHLEAQVRESGRELAKQDAEFSRLWAENQVTHGKAQAYIDELEHRVRCMEEQLRQYQRSLIARMGHAAQTWATRPSFRSRR